MVGETREIIVTGSRHWDDAQELYHFLDKVVSKFGGQEIRLIHGAAKGADTMAHNWAMERGYTSTGYPANWQEFGKSAGMRRNRWMLDAFPNALVVAFPLPGGKGTQGMMAEAKKRGREVIEYENLASMADR